MKSVETSCLKQGMVIAENVYSKNGQLIVSANSSLTRQMISHLVYYRISSVNIIDDEKLPEQTKESLNKKSEVERTHMAKLLSSQEYAIFKKQYQQNVSVLEDNFNDIILKNTRIDEPELITDTVE